MNFCTLPEAVAQLGEQYDAVYYAVVGKHIVTPKCYGRTKLLTPQQVDALRHYFDERRSHDDETDAVR